MLLQGVQVKLEQADEFNDISNFLRPSYSMYAGFYILLQLRGADWGSCTKACKKHAKACECNQMLLKVVKSDEK